MLTPRLADKQMAASESALLAPLVGDPKHGDARGSKPGTLRDELVHQGLVGGALTARVGVVPDAVVTMAVVEPARVITTG